MEKAVGCKCQFLMKMLKKCELCLLRHGQTVNHAYYVATANELHRAEQNEGPEFRLNNCTSNMTMPQPTTMSVKQFMVQASPLNRLTSLIHMIWLQVTLCSFQN